jgi:hypothetical protein
MLAVGHLLDLLVGQADQHRDALPVGLVHPRRAHEILNHLQGVRCCRVRHCGVRDSPTCGARFCRSGTAWGGTVSHEGLAHLPGAIERGGKGLITAAIPRVEQAAWWAGMGGQGRSGEGTGWAAEPAGPRSRSAGALAGSGRPALPAYLYVYI